MIRCVPFAVASLLAPALGFAAGDPFEGDPHQSRAWPELKREHFGANAKVVFDKRVEVQGPSFAENPMNVPITVRVMCNASSCSSMPARRASSRMQRTARASTSARSSIPRAPMAAWPSCGRLTPRASAITFCRCASSNACSLVGTPQAIDLNRISTPPAKTDVPPYGAAHRHDIPAAARWYGRLTID